MHPPSCLCVPQKFQCHLKFYFDHVDANYSDCKNVDKSVQTAVEDGLNVVCSAVVFDDLFRQVRLWVRMGYTAKEIQREIDERFRDVLDTLSYQELERLE